MYLKELVTNVFGSPFFDEINNPVSCNESLDKDHSEIQRIINQIEQRVGQILFEAKNENNLVDDREGRLGPKLVRLDTSTHHGLFIVSSDRLSVNSQSNFSTMRANTGVYRGKWMYEVQLGSKGVMQLGWGTAQCKFNQESGVGDIVNSYAYDGNRVRKWNVSTHKYGEPWLSGDIIGCAIDMDNGSISFYRNGKNLGVAFERITMGPGILYFPTVSLAFTENITTNFGTTPMRYPIEGYQILQQRPAVEIQNAQILFEWLERLLKEYKNLDDLIKFCKEDQIISIRAFMACVARCILKQIGPLVAVPYIAQDIFVPFVKKIIKIDNDMLFTCLDLMWTFLEKHEMKVCLETAVTYLSSVFRQVSVVLKYPDQCAVLVLLNNLCQHTRTRHYLLQFILFDKVKFANFIHVKPVDDDCLNNIVNTIWWETSPIDSLIESNKVHYTKACDEIKFCVTVESLQVELLKTLLINTDGDATSTPTSRTIFLRKFRRFVKENLISSRSEFLQPMPMHQTPLPITLCCFHRLLVTFRVLWNDEIGLTNPVYTPCRSFCDSSINYSGIDRIGGVLSHLNKAFQNDLLQLLGSDHLQLQQETVTAEAENTQLTANAFAAGNTRVAAAAAAAAESPVISVFARMINVNSVNVGGSSLLERIGYFPYHSREDGTPMQLGPQDSAMSLIELLDGIILFYHAAAKKQIAKVANIRDVMSEYIIAISETKNRLDLVKNFNDRISQDIQLQLLKTIEIFNKKLTEQARHMAWVRAVVYSEEKQQRLVWLLKTILTTLEKASENGNLFSFVPEFYLEVLADLLNSLKNHIHPTVPMDRIAGFKEMLQEIAQFLCDHFQDTRIVNANSKDTLILTLAGFASNSMTLEALESVSRDSRMKMVSNLLRSYENRAWAQSNWILVRFWQGNGFAFRYDKSPHIAKKVGPKILNQESLAQPIKPCPSSVFQDHIKQVLLSNNQATTLFLNSLLNQLNWAFSEFIGMIQEIHNVSSRPERVFIESRQLKICATCFDLAVSLLRVLEMIASIAPNVFTDSSLPSSENLLARLCQLLCQILNRTSMQTSSFQHVVLLDIPDLQTVDHFPILTAVVGILLALLKEDMLISESDQVPKVTKAIITEPSFQMTSLYFVLGDVKNTKIKNLKPFSFLNYKDQHLHVTEAEIDLVKKMIRHLDYYRTQLPLAETPCNDDDLCTICYAYPITAIFKPCNHTSCHACIDRHLLNSRNCFFCKASITQVVSTEGKVLHEFSSETSIQVSSSESTEDSMQP
ncbi:E3 ubiquitin-protein ligase RNF123 isoform X2 [Nasonia vitripennis]|uniref:RING-type E3 ubiquitin transferase n=1 Tax=Nasonia vitripennis TaxID=7425 RepID=A0A7M7H725_NASVI|nr:E3 ubiquitin-protein ligase RNF123 isoform X2 [Nasonia vitripennis]